MKSDFFLLFVVFMAGGLLAYLIATFRYYRQLKEAKSRSVRQSRSAILGEVSEKMTPLFPDFPYQSKDLVFLGKGVDYVVFDGLSEGALREIVFLEVKSGKSQLNKNEQMIRNYLSQHPVRYELLKITY